MRKKLQFSFSVEIYPNSKFEGMNFIDSNSFFSGEMGLGSYLANNVFLNAKIGRFSSIGSFVRCNTGVHPLNKFVSTSPVFYSVSKKKYGGTFVNNQLFEEHRFADTKNEFGVIIGNDCWIGEGVFFVGGITVGDGAVALAHSVITKDIPPYSVVGGIPAKVIKYRFDEKTIEYLLKIKWWKNDISWFQNNIALMADIEKFKEQVLIKQFE
ncbi:MAG: CatB-related O-acetyltransferase [Paludibacter sp.]